MIASLKGSASGKRTAICVAALFVAVAGLWLGSGVLLTEVIRDDLPLVAWGFFGVMLVLGFAIGAALPGVRSRRVAFLLCTVLGAALSPLASSYVPSVGVAWYFARHREVLVAQAEEVLARSGTEHRPSLGWVNDPAGLGYIFIYDPNGLLQKAEAEGKNATSFYVLSERPLKDCSQPAPGWYHCVIS